MKPTEYFTVEQVAREVRGTKEKVIVYCKGIEKYCEIGTILFEIKRTSDFFSLDNLLLIESINK